MSKSTTLVLLIILSFLFSNQLLSAQCMIRPLSFEQRVAASKSIIIGTITEQETYRDEKSGNINTLNKVVVNAWLKNQKGINELYVITEGGVLGNEATIVEPALQLVNQQEYVLLLGEDNQVNDNKLFRHRNPEALQVFVYGDQQGAMQNVNNSYYDIGEKINQSEVSLLDRIQNLTGIEAKKPSGESFQPRQVSISTSVARIAAISSFSPDPTRGGTIVSGDYITITGSGFGAAAGTVFFSNSNDGGATFTSSGIASDITSWSDASITVKVPQNGGTGPINVNGAMTSATNLTVIYGHTAINSTFSGFGTSTRQRCYHRNMDGLGGYTFLYNTTSGFSANAAATAAFERALATWRCATYINWRTGGSTATGIAADGINVVMFDGTLPAGVLGRATSRFQGTSTGGCTTTNTVWCVNEMDIQFYPDPPVAGFPWEYGPSLPSFSEYDFETVALHELGHCHGLQHVINSGAVMHFALSNGSANRLLSGNDVAGGSARMTYSTAATCFNPALCGSGPITALTSGNCSTLPVHLLSFTGEKILPTENKLNWQIDFEQNNRGYYVQRSSDGNNFIDIGFIPARGNSSLLQNYSYTDSKTGPFAWYYRLRMMDIDQKETYSSVIYLNDDGSTKWKVWSGAGDGKIYFYNSSPQNAAAVFKLYTPAGQEIYSQQITDATREINIDKLPNGVYLYRLRSSQKEEKGKLVIMNN